MDDAAAVRIQTPIGPIRLRFVRHPFQLLRVGLVPSADAEAQAPAPEVLPEELESVCSLIRDYFRHIPIDPPWPLLSLDPLTRLERRVLYETAKIPYGTQQTYKALARAIGRPASWRFVGAALGKNPFPLLIPCHRVIRSDGRIGGFGAGQAVKKRLIAWECKGSSCGPG